jgi:hypothetical protein
MIRKAGQQKKFADLSQLFRRQVEKPKDDRVFSEFLKREKIKSKEELERMVSIANTKRSERKKQNLSKKDFLLLNSGSANNFNAIKKNLLFSMVKEPSKIDFLLDFNK